MQVGIAAVNFVCGFILVIGSYVMEGLEETRDMQRWLVHVFRCVPPFNLGASCHARDCSCVCALSTCRNVTRLGSTCARCVTAALVPPCCSMSQPHICTMAAGQVSRPDDSARLLPNHQPCMCCQWHITRQQASKPAGEGLIELNKYNVEHQLADTAGAEAARAGIHLQVSLHRHSVGLSRERVCC